MVIPLATINPNVHIIVKKTTKIKEYDGIIPVIRGWAKIYGYNKIIVDDDDPFYSGFQVI